MKIAYFDCFSGISGDMVLGALIDAGLDAALLQAEIDKLGLPDLRLAFHPTSKHAIAATWAEVKIGAHVVTPEQEHHLDLQAHDQHTPQDTDLHKDHGTKAHDHHTPHDTDSGQHDQHANPHHLHQHQTTDTHAPVPQHHHHLDDILRLITQSTLDAVVKEKACHIYQRLAEAEAQVHGAPPEKVHLHEVGALDAVVDIVGAVAGLHLLQVEKVYASPLRCGTGMVRCAHGRYPVPVPGVLALCRDVPLQQTDIAAELITPTGAAIITTLATAYGSAPPYRLQRVGYGAGRRDLEQIPNLLRLRLGQTENDLQADQAVLIEANIDDMNPEIYGYLYDLLLEKGAKEVYITPVHMKKGRPGNLLSVLVDEAQLDLLCRTVLSETTTIGLRYHRVERRKLQRRIITVDTPYGPVRAKLCRLDTLERLSPEYEDCARIAREQSVPILEVYAAASRSLPID
jgi:uncharacterized protein (TIGR00299 family) protein